MVLEQAFGSAGGGRLLVWDVAATAGVDSAWVWLRNRRLDAVGSISGQRPASYLATYTLETDDNYCTRRLLVESRSDSGHKRLEVNRLEGRWAVNGEHRADLGHALDIDLAGCPFTNTMPILRHQLHSRPGAYDLVMAFVSLPELNVVAAGQHYEHVRIEDGRAVVRYSSKGFRADLVVDGDGLVLSYPRLGARRKEAHR